MQIRNTVGFWADSRGLSYVEYLIVLCVVALLGFGAWRSFGESLSHEVEAAGSDVSRFHAAAGMGSVGGSSNALVVPAGARPSKAEPSSFGQSVMDSILNGGFRYVGGEPTDHNTYLVSQDAIGHLKRRLRDAGIEPPAGDSGHLTGPHGVTADFNYNRSTGTLNVTVTDKNFYVGYDDIWKALDEEVAPYVAY